MYLEVDYFQCYFANIFTSHRIVTNWIIHSVLFFVLSEEYCLLNIFSSAYSDKTKIYKDLGNGYGEERYTVVCYYCSKKNYHKLSDSKQHKCILLHILRSGYKMSLTDLKPSSQQSCFLLEAAGSKSFLVSSAFWKLPVILSPSQSQPQSILAPL